MKKTIISAGLFLSLVTRAHASVVLDEVMYDVPGTDDGREWVEVTNTGIDAVDMTGWKFFEANINHSLAVSQGAASIPAGGFAIIADNPQKFLLDWPGFSGTIFDSTFSLSNSGETLALKDSTGTVMDTFAYDPLLGAGGDGTTLQFVSVGWTTQAPTPGLVNETPPAPPEPPSDDPPPPPEPDNSNPPPSDPPPESDNAQVIINEIMYDVPGSDSNHEWIELENLGPTSTDLASWKLVENETDHRLTLVQGAASIGAAEFAVIADDAATFLDDHPGFSGTLFDSTFDLSNTGESIALKDDASAIRDQVAYDGSLGAGGDGDTLQHFDAGFIASAPTPGAMNVLESTHHADDEAINTPAITPSAPPVVETAGIASSHAAAPAERDTPDLSRLEFSIIERDKYGFVRIFNPTDASIDISKAKLAHGSKIFAVPKHTVVAAHVAMVIGNAKARFAGANRAACTDNKITIQ